MMTARALQPGDMPDLVQQLRRLMAQFDVVDKLLRRPLTEVMPSTDDRELATKLHVAAERAANRAQELLTRIEERQP